MLRHRLIHPEINAILGRAGHHGTVLIADGNYPASSKRGPQATLVSLNLMPGVVTCNQVLEGSDEWIGQTVECPSCSHEFVVPGPSAGAASAAPAGNVCPNCGKPMAADAVLCIECGFHTGMGKVISTDLG